MNTWYFNSKNQARREIVASIFFFIPYYVTVMLDVSWNLCYIVAIGTYIDEYKLHSESAVNRG